MCSLCGVLGDRGHWTERATHPDIFAGRPEQHTWHRERQQRTRVVNAVLEHYGLSLSDWAASHYVLRNRTGRTAMVANLTELWPAAEALAKHDCDPLDPELIEALSRDG